MTNGNLAKELGAIGRKLDAVLALERASEIALDRQFADENVAIVGLLQSVQEAKSTSRWRNTRFNVFEVLGRPRLEVAHSHFLAWLLDPAEAHGLGDAFLREFMQRAIGKVPHSTLDVTVSKELPRAGLRFDICVRGDRWGMVVENKIDDLPWEQQCRKYREYCQKMTDRGEQTWLVYVTPACRPPGKTSWLSYREARKIVESLAPDASAATLIDDFCEHIISELEPQHA